jgi:hypothetical protein
MSAQSNLIKRLSVIPAPGWIIVGYVLGLFAATAGVVAWPFSIITMGLFVFTIGVFFLMALPILVLVYMSLLVAAYRASIKVGRRLLFGEGHGSAFERTSKSSLKQKNLSSEPIDGDLWDRWIDGAW